MAQTIRLKRTSTTGNTWENAPSFLAGEMALNTTDEKIWVGTVDDTSAVELAIKREETGTTTSTTATTIATYDGTKFNSAKLLIQIKDTVTGEFQSSELLVVHNGTTAYSTEYGVVYSDVLLASFSVNYNTGTIEIQATANSANSTSYTVSKNLIEG